MRATFDPVSLATAQQVQHLLPQILDTVLHSPLFIATFQTAHGVRTNGDGPQQPASRGAAACAVCTTTDFTCDFVEQIDVPERGQAAAVEWRCHLPSVPGVCFTTMDPEARHLLFAVVMGVADPDTHAQRQQPEAPVDLTAPVPTSFAQQLACAPLTLVQPGDRVGIPDIFTPVADTGGVQTHGNMSTHLQQMLAAMTTDQHGVYSAAVAKLPDECHIAVGPYDPPQTSREVLLAMIILNGGVAPPMENG
jgi:hypothetical protein